jgi:CRISPR-associated exonuclease Cas4
MEQESESVFIGKLIHENSYERKQKEMIIDGAVKIDFLGDEAVHEVKKSDAMEEAHEWQLLFYIYKLRQKGSNIKKGIINYPKQRKTKEIEYTEEIEKKIATITDEIVRIKEEKTAPEVLNSKICKSCSYEDFCYA